MSVVYRGHDPLLDRVVALKVLHPHLTGRAESRARFSREARAAARLEHPNIVAVHDYAGDADAQAYIVTEFIDGPTLRGFVEQHPITRPEVAALIMLPLFEALAHAHSHGVIHRDVKPENIMFRADGSPVLMDFGIAQIVDMETLTSTGTILGSPAHMAPEIVDGEAAEAPADLFSAGTVLYWLVCGALPFSGPTPAALFRRILEVRFDPVLQRRPHAGRALARLIEACLARAPGDRPKSASEIVRHLRGLLDEAGLVDPQQELANFYEDPEVYQEQLGRRLVPVYLAAAQSAWSVRQIPQALDLLDRLMAIDDGHPEAQALLARIERGRRSGIWLRWGLAAAALIALGTLTWWAAITPPGDASDGGLAAIAQDGGAAAGQGITGDAQASSTAIPDAAIDLDAQISTALATDSQITDSQLTDAQAADTQAPDARFSDRLAAAGLRRRRIRRRRDAAVTPPAAPDASVPVPEIPVEFRVGQWQGATISVDGARVGYGGTLMARQARGNPLTLPPGRHTVEITLDQCEPFSQTYTLKAGQRRQLVSYACDFQPATLVVKTRDNARLSVLASNTDGTTFRGFTNAPLPIKMSRDQSPIRVSVQQDGRLLGFTEASLRAGRQLSLTYPFDEGR